MDSVVDRKLPNNLNYVSIFIKLIGHKIYYGCSDDLYLRFRMNFEDDVVQTKAPQFMDMGILTINTSDEDSVLGTPATRIQSPTDGSHWSTPEHFFGEAAAVGISSEKSDHDYNYKTYFKIWIENKEFERQNISMS